MSIKPLNVADTEALLQALRNITREHMNLLARTRNMSIDETRDVVCVDMSLHLMKKHNFKQDNPL